MNVVGWLAAHDSVIQQTQRRVPRPCGESANIGVKLPSDIGGCGGGGWGVDWEGRVDQTQQHGFVSSETKTFIFEI